MANAVAASAGAQAQPLRVPARSLARLAARGMVAAAAAWAGPDAPGAAPALVHLIAAVARPPLEAAAYLGLLAAYAERCVRVTARPSTGLWGVRLIS